MDELPGSLQDLLGIVVLSPFWGRHTELWGCWSGGGGLGEALWLPTLLFPPAFGEASPSNPAQARSGGPHAPAGGSQGGQSGSYH